MLKPLMICTSCVIGGTAIAAPLDALDLNLQLESIGFSSVTIYDDEYEIEAEFDFLNMEDDIWGVSAPYTRFSVGEDISVTAELDEQSAQVNNCSIGGFSCNDAFGLFDEESFYIGDGDDATEWGDFSLAGGTDVGDDVTLETFSGDFGFEFLNGGGYVTWDTFIQNFAVTSNSLAPVDPLLPVPFDDGDPIVAPLPASFLLLFAGLGSFGIMRRRSKKTTSDLAA